MEPLKYSEVAEMLGISRQYVYQKVKDLDLEPVVINDVKHLSKNSIELIKESMNQSSNFTPNKTLEKDEYISVSEYEKNLLNAEIEALKHQIKEYKDMIKDKDYQIGALIHLQQTSIQTLGLKEPENQDEQTDKKLNVFQRIIKAIQNK